VFQNGTGVLTLTGTNTYVDGTIVNNGVLQVGNGGTTGSIGNGTLTVCSKIVFNRSDAYTFSGNISDAYNSLDPYSYSRLWVTGMVVQAGSGTLTLSGTKMNMYDPDLGNYGSLTASNGTMVVSAASSVYGNVTVSGGAFTASAIGTVGTLTVSNNLTITSGILQVTVNKALSPAQSNSVYLVASNLTATGGTLKLVNYGPAFVPGDKFVIFRQVDGVTPKPVSGGLSMAVTAPGVTSFINNLAADGSVTVQTLSATPLAFSSAARSGANLNLTWPSDWTGMHLQSQTNMLSVGLTTNWVTIAGSDAANGYTNTLNTTNGSVFYRLAP
jgi:autotransporter-associated beta strand protein